MGAGAGSGRGAHHRNLLADRDGAVAVEFAMVAAFLLLPFLLMLADGVLRITGERRLQDAMHVVSMTVASDPERLANPADLLAMAADVAAIPPADLELKTSAVCYCPDAQGSSAAPVGCQAPCSGRLTFHSLELVHHATSLLPFALPLGDIEAGGQRARALVLAP